MEYEKDVKGKEKREEVERRERRRRGRDEATGEQEEERWG